MNCILLPPNATTISSPTQIKHIKEVLKSRVGDSLSIGEIGGKLGQATIAKIEEDAIILRDIELHKEPPAKLNVTLILALPRPKVLRRLVMDMTSLGVNHIIIVNSYRTQKSYWQTPLFERLDEFVLEGLQQAVDTIAPTITFKKRLKPFVEDELPFLEGKGVIAHPYASRGWSDYLKELKSQEDMPKILCIGAEGGWIEYEVALFAQQGCEVVSLGERILRTETVVSVLLGHWLKV
jgi:RsmE family RNA methyltransferase